MAGNRNYGHFAEACQLLNRRSEGPDPVAGIYERSEAIFAQTDFFKELVVKFACCRVQDLRRGGYGVFCYRSAYRPERRA